MQELQDGTATCLALLRKLEISLVSGQMAFLRLDAAAAEQCTREQTCLYQKLGAHLSYALSAFASQQGENHSQGNSPMRRQLLAAAERVRYLARVQASLLRRALQFSWILTNSVAGSFALYGPPTVAPGGKNSDLGCLKGLPCHP